MTSTATGSAADMTTYIGGADGRRAWDTVLPQRLDSGGVRISFRHFESPTQPSHRIVLVHGGRAHSGWWRQVVAHLPTEIEVLAPDLSGHGRSGHRSEYRPELWADEIADLTAGIGWTSYSIVGHSMGGKVGVVAAARHRVESLVLIDTPFATPTGFEPFPTPPSRQKRIYKSYDEAIGHFRLTPDQPFDDADLLAAVATEALEELNGEWTWKFDPQAFRIFQDSEVLRLVSEVPSRLGYIRGGRSALTTAETVDLLGSSLGRAIDQVLLPEAYHHVPLDSPERAAQAVLWMLGRWGL